MKTKILFCFLLCFTIKINAQKGSIASGGNAYGAGGKVSYSVGQVAYTTFTGSGGSILQGLQQPYEIVILGTDNFTKITLSISVYPNPTNNLANLKVDYFNFENLQFYLTDVTGKQLQSQKISEIETQIQMENLPKAVYFLNVLENNNLLKSFKIIKN